MQEPDDHCAAGNPDFAALLVRVQNGSDGATRLLIDSYGPHILRIVRRRLSRQMRSKYDSLDFVQAVWTSFFARRSDLVRFTRPEEMVAFLGVMATNKVIDETRTRMLTERGAGRREVPLEPGSPRHDAALAAQQPTPSEAVAVKDLWEVLLEGQPSHYRRILQLRRTGLPYEDIARQLGVNEKTVRRVIDKLVRTRLPWVMPN
jgi:RNA polymerase sigma-70 factor (ECF subfamily)